ncbi:HD domain-containing protein [Fictibacillus macauensis ZFHKF-1]|uniref:HD domain-containing protein n=1 Tax=Fictibacillus macauensis ZFHKF-1 TaxID=1196324 RepID=I8J4V2_9BACL|nr:HD domain-containing protein [Fictibacillus macauensis]EIT86826.1 HD domain-containing protein [Fictibacillus macauensis ZFHKF-1]
MNTVLEAATSYVKEELAGEGSGHDWWHIYRVEQLAITLATEEGADLFICRLAALLHDVADEKLNESEEAGMKKVADWLALHAVDPEQAQHVLSIIQGMSFKGGGGQIMPTLEGKIVQDADRLDALGAVGIARTFQYSGNRGQLIYDPDLPVRVTMTKEEYRNGRSTAINHFYEKLLKLKEHMNTDYGKKLAEERHAYMETFLKTFYAEWDGKK